MKTIQTAGVAFGFSSIYLRDGLKLAIDSFLFSQKQLIRALRELGIPIA